MTVLSEYGPVLIVGSFVSAAVLSALVCLAALALYRRAVGRLMARRAGPAYAPPAQAVFSNQPATLTLDQHLEPVRPPFFQQALRQQRRLANVYALAALCSALLLAMGWVAPSGVSPVRLPSVSTIAAWPIVLTSIYILGTGASNGAKLPVTWLSTSPCCCSRSPLVRNSP